MVEKYNLICSYLAFCPLKGVRKGLGAAWENTDVWQSLHSGYDSLTELSSFLFVLLACVSSLEVKATEFPFRELET